MKPRVCRQSTTGYADTMNNNVYRRAYTLRYVQIPAVRDRGSKRKPVRNQEWRRERAEWRRKRAELSLKLGALGRGVSSAARRGAVKPCEIAREPARPGFRDLSSAIFVLCRGAFLSEREKDGRAVPVVLVETCAEVNLRRLNFAFGSYHAATLAACVRGHSESAADQNLTRAVLPHGEGGTVRVSSTYHEVVLVEMRNSDCDNASGHGGRVRLGVEELRLRGVVAAIRAVCGGVGRRRRGARGGKVVRLDVVRLAACTVVVVGVGVVERRVRDEGVAVGAGAFYSCIIFAFGLQQTRDQKRASRECGERKTANSAYEAMSGRRYRRKLVESSMWCGTAVAIIRRGKRDVDAAAGRTSTVDKSEYFDRKNSTRNGERRKKRAAYEPATVGRRAAGRSVAGVENADASVLRVNRRLWTAGGRVGFRECRRVLGPVVARALGGVNLDPNFGPYFDGGRGGGGVLCGCAEWAGRKLPGWRWGRQPGARAAAAGRGLGAGGALVHAFRPRFWGQILGPNCGGQRVKSRRRAGSNGARRGTGGEMSTYRGRGNAMPSRLRVVRVLLSSKCSVYTTRVLLSSKCAESMRAAVAKRCGLASNDGGGGVNGETGVRGGGELKWRAGTSEAGEEDLE
ncbi:hypothetical protein C8R45DRAFT_1071585 [Mycena sanguinolenta]|nr:hypothetical protein C8R45DRAFT_1071585 [Mycena sanguinolenta]